MPASEVPDIAAVGPGPDGGCIIDEKADEDKPWDKFLRTAPVPEAAKYVEDGWTLLHDGRSLEAALIAASAELVGDLIWGNLALPIDKTLEKLRVSNSIMQTPKEERTDEQQEEDAAARKECRVMLELSTQQLEEMMEKKGEFGREYRIVTAAWYMMMMDSTHLNTPLMAPEDASKAAWAFNEQEYERRKVEGQKWRTAREDEVVFDADRAMRQPYQFGQTRRRYEFTVTIPVPPKTRASMVRVKVTKTHLRVHVTTHPLGLVIDGDTYGELRPSDTGGEWHLEGEFESRRLVLDIEKEKLRDWPCLMRSDAPAEEPQERPVVSGAKGEVDVYEETEVLFKPTAADRFFSWGSAPSKEAGGARSIPRTGDANAASAEDTARAAALAALDSATPVAAA